MTSHTIVRQSTINVDKTKNFASVVAKLSLLFTIYSICTGILFLHFRRWDAEILKQMMGIIAYPTAFFGAVAFCSQRWRQNLWVLPIGVLIFMACPFLVAIVGAWSLPALAVGGIVATAWSCNANHHRFPVSEAIGIVGVAIFLAGFYFFIVNGYGYAHIFADFSTYIGHQHRDTLFHAAIINMLARFGIPSTGLDGVIPIAYHVGIHRWIAANLSLLGGTTPILMAICLQVALLPVFFFSTACAILSISTVQISALTVVSIMVATFWLTASRLWDSYLTSESYAFSISILVAMVPLGKTWIQRAQQYHWLQILHPWEIMGVVVSIAACWSAKVSSGLILVTYLTACILWPRLLRNPKKILGPIIILIVLGGLCFTTIAKFYLNIDSYSLYPFHFARSYPNQFIWQIIIFIISLLIVCFLNKKYSKQTDNFKLPIALALTSTFLVALMPGSLLEIGGGSAGYFTLPTILISSIFGITTLIEFWTNSQDSINYDSIPQTRNRYHHQSSKVIASFGLVIAFLIVLLSSSPELPSYSSKALAFLSSLKEVSSFTKTTQPEVSLSQYLISSRAQDLISPPALDKTALLTQTDLGRVQRLVTRMKLNPDNTTTALYIPPSYETFWNARDNQGCWDISLVTPAITGLPLLNGVRSGLGECEATLYYGMADYEDDSLNYSFSAEELCHKADRFGFNQVYKISEAQEELYHCRDLMSDFH